MNLLDGPLFYYSLFGARGVFLGVWARLLGTPIEVIVAVPAARHPVHLRLRTTDVSLCKEILVDSHYDCELSAPPRVIVDAGANIGLAAIFYANRYPDCRIVAIEPEQSNYDMLLKNTAPYPNITTMRAALWNKQDELTLFDQGGGHTSFRACDSLVDSDAKHSGSTRAVPLEKVMADLAIDHIDLLKVDVEGSEREIFKICNEWIGSVGVIAVEIHEWIQSGCANSVLSATTGFELRWRVGDTNYFARNGRASFRVPSICKQETAGSQKSAITESKNPLRILRTV